MNLVLYKEILQNHVTLSILQTKQKIDQDCNPKYTSCSTKEWLKEKKHSLLHTTVIATLFLSAVSVLQVHHGKTPLKTTSCGHGNQGYTNKKYSHSACLWSSVTFTMNSYL